MPTKMIGECLTVYNQGHNALAVLLTPQGVTPRMEAPMCSQSNTSPDGCAQCGAPLNKGRLYCSRVCSGRGFPHDARSVAERFWQYVDRHGPNGCWVWTASRDLHGYGQIFRGGHRQAGSMRAHRVSWVLHYGPIPNGLGVLHHCDNPPCVRPDHLWLGTPRDNSEDRDRKGRTRPPSRPAVTWQQQHPERILRGAQISTAKLTDALVLEMRRRYAAGDGSYKSLAREYGISKATCAEILTGKIWRHVTRDEVPV